MKPRPTTAKPDDKPVPTHYRWLQAGAMIFQPTMLQRLKLLIGYNIQISLTLKMEHNPGDVKVASRFDATKQNEFEGVPKIEELPEKVEMGKRPPV